MNLNKNKNLKSTYNKIAKDWAKDHENDTWWNEGTQEFVSLLKAGDRILDIGCGSGEKSKFFIDKGFNVTGLDLSEEMIKLAQIKAPEGKFNVKDILEPLNLKEVFDAVFAQAVLLHIPKDKIEDVLRNIIKPLKIGGYLYIAVKEIRPGQKEEDALIENDYGYEYERFFSYFSLDELRNYFKKVNLNIKNEDITKFGKTNWIQLIAQK